MKKIFAISLVLFLAISAIYCTYTVAQEGPPGPPPNCGDYPPDGDCPPCNFDGPPCDGHHGPNGPDDHHGKHDGKHQKELTAEQESELIAFIQQYLPTKYNQLMEMKEADDMHYKKAIAKTYPMMMHLKKIEKNDKEMFDLIIKKEELDAQSMDLARQYREAEDDATKASIESEMQVVLSELFDLRQKEEKCKIDKMEEKLAELKALITERDKNKDIIVQNRIDELTGKSKYTNW